MTILFLLRFFGSIITTALFSLAFKWNSLPLFAEGALMTLMRWVLWQAKEGKRAK